MNSTVNLYEQVINKSLKEDRDRVCGLHEGQYGFRENRSTINAIEHVFEAGRKRQSKRTAKKLQC